MSARRCRFMRRNLALLVAAVFVCGHLARGDAGDAAQASRLFELLSLQRGMSVAEVGAGTGAMTVEMAKRLGPDGHVYSNELNPERLADIRKAVAREHLQNVTLIQSSDASANFPEACCDAIFMRDVYHHFTKPAEMDESLVRSLKPGGRLAVIDFEPARASGLPAGVPQNRGGHGIHPATVREELEAAGLAWSNTNIDWAPDHLFIVLAKKP